MNKVVYNNNGNHNTYNNNHVNNSNNKALRSVYRGTFYRNVLRNFQITYLEESMSS